MATIAESAIYHYRQAALGGKFIAWPGHYRRLPLADTQIEEAPLQANHRA